MSSHHHNHNHLFFILDMCQHNFVHTSEKYSSAYCTYRTFQITPTTPKCNQNGLENCVVLKT